MGDWSWTGRVAPPNLGMRREGKRHSSEHRSPYQNDPHAAALALFSLFIFLYRCYLFFHGLLLVVGYQSFSQTVLR
jgi:hypothetical protein